MRTATFERGEAEQVADIDVVPPRTTEVLPHVPALDGVRALAVLLVLAIHLQIVPKTTALETVLFAFTSFGWVGVDLFFVLSGYLITSILLRTKRSPDYYRSFYARRSLRIFPVYYAVLLALFLFDRVTSWRVPMPTLWDMLYLQNIRMAWINNVGESVLSITWSLAVEEQFYLLWPLVVRRLGTTTLIRVSVAAIIAAPVIRTVLCLAANAPVAAYVLMPARMDGLAAGALIAALHSRERLSAYVRPALLVLGAGMAMTIGVTWFARGFPFLRTSTLTVGISGITCLFAGLLVLVLADERKRLARTLSWQPLRTIGGYSYAMYLFHYPVKNALTAALPQFAQAETVPVLMGTRWIAQCAFYVLAVGLTFIAARTSWWLLESRVLSLKSRFGY